MRPPLKLNSIDQEHLQELYNAAGVARDELPYTDSYTALCEGFQDRTFKNADPEQVYGALLKYVRSSSNASKEIPATQLTEDQLKQLKSLLPRHAKGSKILPYSDEFDALHKEFIKHASVEITTQDLWRAIVRSQGGKRRPPSRAKVAAPVEERDEDESGE